MQKPIDMFKCPSDVHDVLANLIINASHSNYVGINHTNQYAVSSGGVGIFGSKNISTRFRDITDGTSNVMMIGERSERPGDFQNKRNTTWVGVSRPNMQTSYYRGVFEVVGTTGKPMNQPRDHYIFNAWLGSMHPGGCQFALADGSVQFLSETISMTVYHRLTDIDDGNPIPNFNP